MIDLKTNQQDKTIPDGQVWRINYRLYICTIEADDAKADMTIYDFNLSENGNRTHNFALDHIEQEHYRRSLINTRDMEDILTLRSIRALVLAPCANGTYQLGVGGGQCSV